MDDMARVLSREDGVASLLRLKLAISIRHTAPQCSERLHAKYMHALELHPQSMPTTNDTLYRINLVSTSTPSIVINL